MPILFLDLRSALVRLSCHAVNWLWFVDRGFTYLSTVRCESVSRLIILDVSAKTRICKDAVFTDIYGWCHFDVREKFRSIPVDHATNDVCPLH